MLYLLAEVPPSATTQRSRLLTKDRSVPSTSLHPSPAAPRKVDQKVDHKIDPYAPFNPVPAGATHPGITLFDWLAAVAMQGLVTHGMEVRGDRALTEEDKDREMANRAYRMAGAMLRAREQALSPAKDPSR